MSYLVLDLFFQSVTRGDRIFTNFIIVVIAGYELFRKVLIFVSVVKCAKGSGIKNKLPDRAELLILSAPTSSVALSIPVSVAPIGESSPAFCRSVLESPTLAAADEDLTFFLANIFHVF